MTGILHVLVHSLVGQLNWRASCDGSSDLVIGLRRRLSHHFIALIWIASLNNRLTIIVERRAERDRASFRAIHL